MPAYVETMAYAGEVPWHRDGVQVDGNLTPYQMLKKAGLDWKVIQQPMYVKFNDEEMRVPNMFALQRDSDGRILSTTSDKYRPVQNEDAFAFFDRFTKAGHMKMETAGSLDGGRFIWALARIAEEFRLMRTDEIQAFLLLMQPHKPGHALITQTTPIRVVCWNTLNLALGEGLRGRGDKVFSMNHLSIFDDDVKAQAEMTLGLAVQQFKQFNAAAQILSKTRIANDNALIEYFDKVIDFDRENTDDKPPRILTQFNEAFASAPGSNLASARGTWWGALNAVTYVADHKLGWEGKRLRNAWIGGSAIMKRKALNIAMDFAQAA